MFASIAPRYDLLNHLLSMQVDRYWRRMTVRRLSAHVGEGDIVLDLATGTGDLALRLAKRVSVVGCDFTPEMMVLGRRKVERKGLQDRLRFSQGDALALPFPDSLFGAVSIAFGLRNLEDYEVGLREMQRVLRPGGLLAILEFSHPKNALLGGMHSFYSQHVLPRVGRWLSGDNAAYNYLPASVREFPGPEELERLIEACGFQDVNHQTLTGGVVALHLARKGSVHGPIEPPVVSE